MRHKLLLAGVHGDHHGLADESEANQSSIAANYLEGFLNSVQTAGELLRKAGTPAAGHCRTNQGGTGSRNGQTAKTGQVSKAGKGWL